MCVCVRVCHRAWLLTYNGAKAGSSEHRTDTPALHHGFTSSTAGHACGMWLRDERGQVFFFFFLMSCSHLYQTFLHFRFYTLLIRHTPSPFISRHPRLFTLYFYIYVPYFIKCHEAAAWRVWSGPRYTLRTSGSLLWAQEKCCLCVWASIINHYTDELYAVFYLVSGEGAFRLLWLTAIRTIQFNIYFCSFVITSGLQMKIWITSISVTVPLSDNNL